MLHAAKVTLAPGVNTTGAGVATVNVLVQVWVEDCPPHAVVQ